MVSFAKGVNSQHLNASLLYAAKFTPGIEHNFFCDNARYSLKVYVAELALEYYQPKLNTNFKIPRVKHTNGIQKRKTIIRFFKILPSSSTRQHLDYETMIVHQSANSLELEKSRSKSKRKKPQPQKNTQF